MGICVNKSSKNKAELLFLSRNSRQDLQPVQRLHQREGAADGLQHPDGPGSADAPPRALPLQPALRKLRRIHLEVWGRARTQVCLHLLFFQSLHTMDWCRIKQWMEMNESDRCLKSTFVQTRTWLIGAIQHTWIKTSIRIKCSEGIKCNKGLEINHFIILAKVNVAVWAVFK